MIVGQRYADIQNGRDGDGRIMRCIDRCETEKCEVEGVDIK